MLKPIASSICAQYLHLSPLIEIIASQLIEIIFGFVGHVEASSRYGFLALLHLSYLPSMRKKIANTHKR